MAADRTKRPADQPESAPVGKRTHSPRIGEHLAARVSHRPVVLPEQRKRHVRIKRT